MKITLQHYEETAEISQEKDDVDIHEMIDLVERLLVASGFSPETVKEGFCEKAREIEEIGEDNVE